MGTVITPVLVTGVLVATFFVGFSGVIIGYLLGRRKFEGKLAAAEHGRMYKIRSVGYDATNHKYTDFAIFDDCMHLGEQWINCFPSTKAVVQKDLPANVNLQSPKA